MASENRLDLIDRNALFPNKVIKVEKNTPTAILEAVWLALMNAPTVDAVEVVRCKDCRYQGRASCPTYYEDRMTYRDCWALDGDNDFCSYGERREGE